MTEVFNFDMFQIPATGVAEPDLDSVVRTSSTVEIRRPINMKISNFGAENVGKRLGTDYTRTDLTFEAKDNLSDIEVLTADTGIGNDVASRSDMVVHNPYLVGSTVKLTRDDQFIRMGMSRNTGSALAAASVDVPKYDIMDAKKATAEGILATTNYSAKNWPDEGWRSFGHKYDFLPYEG